MKTLATGTSNGFGRRPHFEARARPGPHRRPGDPPAREPPAMAPPKTVLDKIVHAITTLSDPTGSSRVALAKFLKREFEISNATLVKKALAKGVKDGKLTQRGQSFALPGCDFAPPEDERLRHEVLRAGDDDARVAGKGDDVVVSYVGTLGAFELCLHTGPRTTASAWWTPFLKDFCSRRFSPPRVPRFQSRHTSTPFNFN